MRETTRWAKDMGLVWVNDLQRSYFVEAREITRGKKSGHIEVVLTDGRKKVVSPCDIFRWPEGAERKVTA